MVYTISIVMHGKQLRSIRKRLDWTQAEMAKAVGVASNTVARWERDEMSISEPMARLIRTILAQEKAKRR